MLENVDGPYIALVSGKPVQQKNINKLLSNTSATPPRDQDHNYKDTVARVKLESQPRPSTSGLLIDVSFQLSIG